MQRALGVIFQGVAISKKLYELDGFLPAVPVKHLYFRFVLNILQAVIKFNFLYGDALKFARQDLDLPGDGLSVVPQGALLVDRHRQDGDMLFILHFHRLVAGDGHLIGIHRLGIDDFSDTVYLDSVLDGHAGTRRHLRDRPGGGAIVGRSKEVLVYSKIFALLAYSVQLPADDVVIFILPLHRGGDHIVDLHITLASSWATVDRYSFRRQRGLYFSAATRAAGARFCTQAVTVERLTGFPVRVTKMGPEAMCSCRA